jgi:hypothetical protein
MSESPIEPLALGPGEGLAVRNLVGGILTFKLTADQSGDELIQAPPGSFVFIPKGTPHTWQNVGDAPARFFVAVMPAATAFERFFLTYARLPAHECGPEAFARLANETQALEVLGPPLAQSDPI